MNTIKISYSGRGKNNQSKGMELNGNLLTGDTFNIRDYIKTFMGGKWDAENKGWIVDNDKVMALLNTPGALIKIAE